MFKNIYYDSYKNEIHLWEIENGKHQYHKIKHDVEYYVEDKTGQSTTTDIYGTPVIKKVAESYKSLNELRRATKLYESDVSEEIKFLQKRYGTVTERTDPSQYNVVVLDIEVAGGLTFSFDHVIKIVDKNSKEEQTTSIRNFVTLNSDDYLVYDEKKRKWVEYELSCYAPVSEFPKPEFAKYPINLITLNFVNKGKIVTFGSDPYTGNSPLVKNYIHDSDEKQLMEKFIQFWKKSKIDIAIAYNAPFDFGYILKRCENLGLDPNLLSPVNRVEYKNPNKIKIHGITILDYIELYKKFSFTPQPSYKLENVAMAEIGEGKTKYEGNIFTIWQTDWNLFVEYNIQDTILVEKMDKKRKFIPLAIKMATESLVPIDKCMKTTAIVEGFVLKVLHQKNQVMSDRIRTSDSDEDIDEDELEGAYVEAHPGFYKHLLSFDVESLYPHMIMMYNISPETKLSEADIKNMDEKDYIKTPVPGVYYRNDVKGILPTITEKIFKERKEYKKLMNDAFDAENEEEHDYFDSMQHNRKILINCFHKDTEIITPDGVRLLKDINVGDMVYSINPENNNLEIKPVMGIVKKPYDGYLNIIDTQRIKVRVTPEHEFIVKTETGNKFFKSEEIYSKRIVIPKHNKVKRIVEKYVYINEHIDMTNYQYVIIKKMDKRVAQKELNKHFGENVITLSDTIKSIPRDIKYINEKLTRNQIDYLIDVLGYQVKIKHIRDCKCKKQNVRIDLIKFSRYVGWYLSEGSAYDCPLKVYTTTTRGRSKKINISQFKNVNPENHSEIEQLSKELFTYVYTNDKRVSVNSDVVYDLIVDNFGKGLRKRLFLTNLGYMLDFDNVKESMYLGDGTKKANRYTISMKNPKLKDDYVKLLLNLGFYPVVRCEYHDKHVGFYRITQHDKDIWIHSEKHSKEYYNDYVYCVNVADNRTVLVGEDGRYGFTSNCLYGTLGSDGFHFYDIDNAAVVTAGGRELIKHLSSNVNDYLKNWLPSRISKYYPDIQNIVVPKSKKQSVVVVDTDSLVGDSVINTSLGNISIESIFNNHSKNTRETFKDNFIADVENLSALSMTKDLKLVQNKVTYIKKHLVKKNMYDFFGVTMTEDHSAMAIRNGVLIDIKPKDIKIGDFYVKLIEDSFESIEITKLPECLGIIEDWVYDIEVENTHNFFGNNILVHNSNYVDISDYYSQIAPTQDFIDFSNDFDSRILTPFFNKLVDIYCAKYNIPNKINFKREKIILKMFVQVKKKYVCQIIANEKEIYDHPKIKITGLETKKSDLPGFCKQGLNELIDVMFSGDSPDEDAMVEVVRKYQKIHKESPVETIAIPKGVNDYKKYSIDFDKGMKYLPHTPIHNRASINHNYMVQKYKLPFREIDDGAKIKYLFVNENNELHQNVIAFDDEWPEIFDQKFKIDRDELFVKTFLDISQRMFDALGFKKISLKQNKMGMFLKK